MITREESEGFEKYVQENYLDAFYQEHCGYTIIDRQGNVGYDLTVEKLGKEFTIEEKIRKRENVDDILIEIMQDVNRGTKGWIHYCQADMLVYVWCDMEKRATNYARIRYKRFRPWLMEYWAKRKYSPAYISPDGQGLTINLAVPLEAIPITEPKMIEYTADFVPLGGHSQVA